MALVYSVAHQSNNNKLLLVLQKSLGLQSIKEIDIKRREAMG